MNHSFVDLENLREQWLEKHREAVKKLALIILVTGLDQFERTSDPRLKHSAEAWFSAWRSQIIAGTTAAVEITVSRQNPGAWITEKSDYAQTMHIIIKSKIDSTLPWPTVADVWFSDDKTHKYDQFIVPGPWLETCLSFVTIHEEQKAKIYQAAEQKKASDLAIKLLFGKPNMGLDYKA